MTFKHRNIVVPTTWVVVADRSRGRILKVVSDGVEPELKEIETLISPEGSMKQSESVSDRQGSFVGQAGAPVAGDPETDFQHKTAESFAIELVSFLESGRNSQQFGRLVLVAPPSFLGTLRKKLPAPLSRMVELEIDKDYTKHSVAEIASHVSKAQATKS